jgi:hypothetical protein
MLRRVILIWTDISEELSASETSILTRATRRNIPEGTILHSLNSTIPLYIEQVWWLLNIKELLWKCLGFWSSAYMSRMVGWCQQVIL